MSEKGKKMSKETKVVTTLDSVFEGGVSHPQKLMDKEGGEQDTSCPGKGEKGNTAEKEVFQITLGRGVPLLSPI